jgi:Undecaprenyl-phosphate glucose phosphotransferase
MLARHRQIFATAVFLLDGALIAASWLAAYWLRFVALPAPLGVPPLGLYLWFMAVVTPVALLVLRSFKLYRSARTARLSQELLTLVQGMAIVTALAGLASYAGKGDLSRGFLLLFAAIATAALCASRLAIRGALRAIRRRGFNLRQELLVGTGELAATLVRKILEHRDYGLVLQGVVAPRGAEPGAVVEGVPVVGTVADLPGLVERTGTEIVYLALPRSEHGAERETLERLSDSTAAVRLVPDLAWAYTLNAGVEDFDGLPVVLVTETPGQGWNAVLKRTFDLVLAALGLVVLAPLLLAIAAWVKLDSPGPALYAQERMGMNGRRFRMLKFRTMRLDAEQGGPGWSRPGDARRTRAGRVLRPLSLDELPQLWNVLVGHMSLVGPRPERPVYVEQFRARVPRYMLRHHVKSGITGWAQVNGLRGDTPLDQRIGYDLYYVRNWSLAFDLKILALTLARVFRDASAH